MVNIVCLEMRSSWGGQRSILLISLQSRDLLHQDRMLGVAVSTFHKFSRYLEYAITAKTYSVSVEIERQLAAVQYKVCMQSRGVKYVCRSCHPKNQLYLLPFQIN